MSETSVTIVGNITKNPELRTTQSGKKVTRLRVASTRKRLIDGEWTDVDSAYIDVDCWEYLAQNVINSLNKGDRIVAEGRLRTDEWQDEHGNKRSNTKIVADSVGPDLRFATATVTRSRTTASRNAEAQRRAREAEMMNQHGGDADDGGNGVDRSGGADDAQTRSYIEGHRNSRGSGGGADAAEFYPDGAGERPVPGAGDGVPTESNHFDESVARGGDDDDATAYAPDPALAEVAS